MRLVLELRGVRCLDLEREISRPQECHGLALLRAASDGAIGNARSGYSSGAVNRGSGVHEPSYTGLAVRRFEDADLLRGHGRFGRPTLKVATRDLGEAVEIPSLCRRDRAP